MCEKCQLTISDFSNYEMIGKVYVHESVNINMLDMSIYRYVKFEHLLSMLDSNKLYISNRQKFPDLRERGSKECLKKIFPLSPISNDLEEDKRCRDELHRRWYASYNICVSCWTKDQYNYGNAKISSENYLMWKAYSNGLTCRIETTIGELINNISVNNHGFAHDILFSEVKYIQQERYADNNPQHYIFDKPIYYRDEQEYRLVVLCICNNVCLRINPYKLLKSIKISPFISNSESERIINYLKYSFPQLDSINVSKSHIMEY